MLTVVDPAHGINKHAHCAAFFTSVKLNLVIVFRVFVTAVYNAFSVTVYVYVRSVMRSGNSELARVICLFKLCLVIYHAGVLPVIFH